MSLELAKEQRKGVRKQNRRMPLLLMDEVVAFCPKCKTIEILSIEECKEGKHESLITGATESITTVALINRVVCIALSEEVH